jgi:hypothetical protein
MEDLQSQLSHSPLEIAKTRFPQPLGKPKTVFHSSHRLDDGGYKLAFRIGTRQEKNAVFDHLKTRTPRPSATDRIDVEQVIRFPWNR